MKLSQGLGHIPGGSTATATGYKTDQIVGQTTTGTTVTGANVLSMLAAAASQVQPYTGKPITTDFNVNATPATEDKSFFEDDSILKGIPNWGTLAGGAAILSAAVYLLTSDNEPQKRKR